MDWEPLCLSGPQFPQMLAYPREHLGLTEYLQEPRRLKTKG